MGHGGGAKEKGGRIFVFCLNPQNQRKSVILSIFLQMEYQDLCAGVNQITPLYFVGATHA